MSDHHTTKRSEEHADSGTFRCEIPKPRLKTAVPILVGVFVLASLLLLRRVLTPVIIALVIAYVADPLLRRLEHHRIRRWVATTMLYCVGLSLVVAGIVLLGPNLASQTRNLYRNVSGMARDYGSSFLESNENERAEEDAAPPLPTPSGASETTIGPDAPESATPTDGPRTLLQRAMDLLERHIPDWSHRTRNYVRQHADDIAGRTATFVVTLAQNTLRGLSSAASFLFGILLVLVFTFFFMLHFQNMIRTVKRYLPAAHRTRTLCILRRVDGAVSSFFRGRLLVCLIAGIVYCVGFRIARVDFWLLIGLAGGILGFIPILGIVLPMIPACAFALLTEHPGASLIGVLLTFALVQWIVEPLAGTLILSHQVKMHPVTILLAMLIGASLFGVFGLILSVPTAAVIRILGEEFVLPSLRELAKDDT